MQLIHRVEQPHFGCPEPFIAEVLIGEFLVLKERFEGLVDEELQGFDDVDVGVLFVNVIQTGAVREDCFGEVHDELDKSAS